MVDQAMDDEQCIATMCHYFMLHCAESTIDMDISGSENGLKMVLNIRDRIFKSVEVF